MARTAVIVRIPNNDFVVFINISFRRENNMSISTPASFNPTGIEQPFPGNKTDFFRIFLF